MSETASSIRKSENVDLLRLSLVPGIGPKTMSSLMEYFNDPKTILETDSTTLQEVPGIGPKLAREISLATKTINVDAVVNLCQEQNIGIVDWYDNRYPKPLLEIHNPPSILYVKGELKEADTLAIAIVGSRHATQYGKRIAERLARGLASAGYTIISGLARGIDSAAHRGALAAGGRTIAVLGSGLMNIYPAEHSDLASEISKNGAVIAEAPPHHPPKSGSFPQRNRIVTGLCLGTIVVEAAQRSGALISARLAMEQGREVFAVPGPVDSRMSQGTHQLIRDGATLVQSVDDVLAELGPLQNPISTDSGDKVHHPAELKLNDLETKILNAIEVQPTAIDSIAEACDLSMQNVLSTISVLEIRRLIRRVSGNAVVRVS